MSCRMFHVNAFVSSDPTHACAGNPAAVCLPSDDRDDGWHQGVAAQMNLSETAYVRSHPDGHALRWFTPVAEVDLCGHATLASAHVLWSEGVVTDDVIRFHTRSGELRARRDGSWIELDFPSRPPAPIDTPAELARVLGAEPQWVGTSDKNLLVELADAHTVRSITPDFVAMAAHGWSVIVTAPADDTAFDFISRYFAPVYGINEDPVTGSAHCALGPYWQSRLGANAFTALQASARGGLVRVRVEGERVLLAGQAETVLCGTLLDAASVALSEAASCSG